MDDFERKTVLAKVAELRAIANAMKRQQHTVADGFVRRHNDQRINDLNTIAADLEALTVEPPSGKAA